MKSSTILFILLLTSSLSSLAQSQAQYVAGSSSTITSSTANSPFRISVTGSSSSNGYIDIGPQSTIWGHILTDRPRFYFNQPLFVNNVGTPANGGVISSYNGLPLVLATGDLNTADATPYYVPRLTITATGEHVYGYTTGQRWRIDPRSGNSGDMFQFGYDNGSGTFYNPLTIYHGPFTAGQTVPEASIGTNFGTPLGSLNIITRKVSSQGGSPVALSLKFGDIGYGSNAYGIWNFTLDQDPILLTKSSLSFWAYDGNGANGTEVMSLFHNGNMSVKEKITCKKVLVTPTVPFPDYVFASNYKLPKLSEVEQFISDNKHLPSVPSELEIEKQGGINVGEMNTILLRKIEELTLYSIQQQKELQLQKKEIESLKKIVESKN